MKKNNRVCYLIIFISIMSPKSCHGMMTTILGSAAAQYIIPAFWPTALFGFFWVKDRLSVNRQLRSVNENVQRHREETQEFREETTQNFEKTRKEIVHSKQIITEKIQEKTGELDEKIDDSTRMIIAKIDETKQELAGKIDESRFALEELINRKINTSERHILAHIGTTRFDVLKGIDEVTNNLNAIKESFEGRLDVIQSALEKCATLDDIGHLESQLQNTLRNMTHMITDSKSELKECLATLDEKAETRYINLCRKNDELKDIITQRDYTPAIEALINKINKSADESKQQYDRLRKKNKETKQLLVKKDKELDKMLTKVTDTHNEVLQMKVLLERYILSKEGSTKKHLEQNT